jgi:type IV secretory pathway VirB6-like protein
MLPINNILEIIQKEIFSGCDFLSKIGMAFFLMFIAVEFIKAAIEATSGRGFTIDKILYLYLFMAVFYWVFPALQSVLKDYAYEGCSYIYEEFGGLTMPIKPSWKMFITLFKTCMTDVVGLLLAPFTLVAIIFVLAFSFFVGLLAMIAMDIIVISAFLSFEIIIAAAPFFIPFFMSGEFSHIGKQWVNNILMCLMQLVLLAIVLKLVNEINAFASDYFIKQVIGKHFFWDMYTVLFIPLLGLGLTWQSLNLTKMLFPPSGGFVGTAVGAPIAGAVGYTAHTVTRVFSGGK